MGLLNPYMTPGLLKFFAKSSIAKLKLQSMKPILANNRVSISDPFRFCLNNIEKSNKISMLAQTIPTKRNIYLCHTFKWSARWSAWLNT